MFIYFYFNINYIFNNPIICGIKKKKYMQYSRRTLSGSSLTNVPRKKVIRSRYQIVKNNKYFNKFIEM